MYEARVRELKTQTSKSIRKFIMPIIANLALTFDYFAFVWQYENKF